MFNKILPMTGVETRTPVSKATALPTEPQPLPYVAFVIFLKSLFPSNYYHLLRLRIGFNAL